MDTFGTFLLLTVGLLMMIVALIAYFRKKAENDRLDKTSK